MITDATEYDLTARRLRDLVEPIAAGVYFAPEATDGYAAHGLNYFEGYFCSRGACLGRAPWSVICAAFAAFKPAIVEQAVTGGWDKAGPDELLPARLAGAEAQLQRLLGDPTPAVEAATALLYELTDGVDPSGRMLYSGLLVQPRPASAWGGLWHAADLVREHRGDGHIAAWIAHLDSTEVTVLTELAWGIPPRSYVYTRGWSEADVDAACGRLEERGLLAGAQLTPEGRQLREDIERQTNQAEHELLDRLGDRASDLFATLQPWAKAIIAGGGYPMDPTRLGQTVGRAVRG